MQLIKKLTARGIRIVVFLGPEEQERMAYFTDNLKPHAPVIFEPALRKFAAMVSQCKLFLTCDSGPMHLACALGVRTIAIFQNNDFSRWGPPAHIARIVHDPEVVSVGTVEAACLAEFSALSGFRQSSPPDQRPSNPSVTANPLIVTRISITMDFRHCLAPEMVRKGELDEEIGGEWFSTRNKPASTSRAQRRNPRRVRQSPGSRSRPRNRRRPRSRP